MPRSLNRYNRMYIDGRDYSGYGSSFGPLVFDPAEVDVTAVLGDSVHGYLPDVPVITPTVFNGLLDNTATTGLHTNLTGQAYRNIMAIIGGVAAPVIGSPCFCGIFTQTAYNATVTNGLATCSLSFGDLDEAGTAGLTYVHPWGYVTHIMGSETAVNSANTNVNGGASTSLGGVMWYHITSITGGSGVTLTLQDSADGTSGWTLITGATVTVAQATPPTSGFICLSSTQVCRQYVRWQIAFNGGATAAVFAQAFVRGNSG